MFFDDVDDDDDDDEEHDDDYDVHDNGGASDRFEDTDRDRVY